MIFLLWCYTCVVGVFIRSPFPVEWLSHEIFLLFFLPLFAFYSFVSVFRTRCLSDGFRARSPLEKIKIFFFFFLCQIGQVLPAQYPRADTQTVDGETAWFRRVTPRKMREHAWQFSRLLSCVTFESRKLCCVSSFLRSAVRFGFDGKFRYLL